MPQGNFASTTVSQQMPKCGAGGRFWANWGVAAVAPPALCWALPTGAAVPLGLPSPHPWVKYCSFFFCRTYIHRPPPSPISAGWSRQCRGFLLNIGLPVVPCAVCCSGIRHGFTLGRKTDAGRAHQGRWEIGFISWQHTGCPSKSACDLVCVLHTQVLDLVQVWRSSSAGVSTSASTF